jgi:hypothetical protein
MSDEKVPFLDLVTVHRGLQNEFVDILKTALSTAGFIDGPMVQGIPRICGDLRRAGERNRGRY